MKKILFYLFFGFYIFNFVSCYFEGMSVPVSLHKNEEIVEEESEGAVPDDKEKDLDSDEKNTGCEEEINAENPEGQVETEEKKDTAEEPHENAEEKESEKNPGEPENLITDSKEDVVSEPEKKEDPEQNDVNENSGEKSSENENNTVTEKEEQNEPLVQEKEPEPEIKEELPVHREWTFMVYMGADNSLEPYAIQNINEMEAGIEKSGPVTVLALLDRIPGFDDSNGNWSGTRLYEIQKDDKGKNSNIVSKRIGCPDLGIEENEETELNLADGNTLSLFVDFVKREYESDHYCLIVWGNGGGWRGCVTDESSSFTMSLLELGKSLENKGLDAVVLDVSFGLTIETLYELRNSCRFVAGTPGVNSDSGLDYEKFFSDFCASSKSMGSFLDKICSVSESEFYAVSLTNIQGVVDSMNETGKALADFIKSRKLQKQVFENLLTNSKTTCSGNYPCDLYISLSACVDYFLSLNNQEILNASRHLQSALQKLSVSGEPVLPSIFLIPVISRGIAVSRHPESYVCPDGKNSDGLVRCSFVKDCNYWVPTGRDISFMDSLFYRSF